LLAIGGRVDGVMFRLQTSLNKAGEWTIVFGDQDARKNPLMKDTAIVDRK
jgi:hypothetical protein